MNVENKIPGKDISSDDLISKFPLTALKNDKKRSKFTIAGVEFDIIYQPELTELLRASQKMGLQILNGSEMNLEQAVIAYGYTAPEPNGKSSTSDAMKEIVLNS